MRKFNVTLAFPWYNECFEEIVRGIAAGLRELGYPVTEKPGYGRKNHFLENANVYMSDATNIVLGYYIRQNPAPPAGSIIYQLEPYGAYTIQTSIPISNLRRYIVWDYSRHNIAMLKQNHGINAVYVPAGFSSAMTPIPAATQDIDVLFYGGLHERRKLFLDELRRRGLRVTATYGIYREPLAALIARAKVVLNLHGGESYQSQESWRMVYPLSFGKAVVTEVNPGDDADGFSSAALCVPYQSLADACVYLVHNDERRHEREQAAREYMKTRPMSAGLKQALEVTYGR